METLKAELIGNHYCLTISKFDLENHNAMLEKKKIISMEHLFTKIYIYIFNFYLF